MRRATALGVLAAAAVGAGGLAAPAAATGPGDLQLIASQQLDSRLVELTFATPALKADTRVRILLPAGYSSADGRRYPVLYLLNGSLDDYRSWTDKGNAEQITAGLPLIVVMPDGGKGGFYSDWYNNGLGGPPEWETYHVGELVPWVDAHYRTVGSRAGRAIAGLSMGGFGAMSYAARHPDVFVAAASFSGAVDTNYFPPSGEPDESTFDGGAPYATWGSRQSEEVRWRAHNPWDLAQNLAGLSLTLRSGNGQPGGPYGGGDPVETYVHQASLDLHQRLDALTIPHVWDDYGPGGHGWPYWQRDLVRTLPTIMATFAHPPPPPSPFTFTAVEPSYDVYGWHVSLQRPVLEFSELRAGASGFTLSGSGDAAVTTPPLYGPGRAYSVTVRSGSTSGSEVRYADGNGRLHVDLRLGPPNPDQQYTPAAQSGPGTIVYTTTVTLPAAGANGPGAASPRGCASRRVVIVRLPHGGRLHYRHITVLVDGRRIATYGGRRSVTINLTGLGPGAVVIRVVARTGAGHTVVVKRRLRTCGQARRTIRST
ncbi:MAG TPA: alpha/beta hydrolase family protein [Solirubrobacteraceae bacterium]|nr:alpha/beta hydrolase family protein [Solirubrobacteraceae bacterium]